jgi:hypothetical protein
VQGSRAFASRSDLYYLRLRRASFEISADYSPRSQVSTDALRRSLSDTWRFLLSLILEQPRLTLSESSSPSPTRVIKASPGDDVMFVPPGVSRTRVPLNGALVLQIL